MSTVSRHRKKRRSGRSGTTGVLHSLFMNSTKKRRTYFTDKRVKAARANIRNYEWARSIRDDAVSRADRYVGLGFTTLRAAVTPQSIPRASRIHDNAGCPVCGENVQRHGLFPYRFDPLEAPWTITCPDCKTAFPSNDFQSYYISGLDDNGFFDPTNADRSLLANTRYPDKPHDWCVDDGYGWIAPDGERRVFIAYYNHWALWGIPMHELR